MGKLHFGFVLIFCFVIFLGLISSASCIIAEFKRPKWKDMKLDDKLCYLPASHSFGFGVAALISLTTAQIMGNLLVCTNCYSREKRSRYPVISGALLVISWCSFGVAVILLSTATSMSKRQSYGKGWLDEECYMIKDGVYFGSGGLVFVSIACTICAAIITISKSQNKMER